MVMALDRFHDLIDLRLRFGRTRSTLEVNRLPIYAAPPGAIDSISCGRPH